MARFDLLVLSLLLSTSKALLVNFQESDKYVREDSGMLTASVTMEDSSRANVTVQVIPQTPQQYLATGRQLPGGVDLNNVDPAEAGLDFDSTPQTLLLERGPRQTREVNIQIYKDNLTELEEVLILELIIIRVDPPDLEVSVSTERNVTIVHIQPSALDYTRISLVAEESRFDESDGNISGALFVQLDRPMEPGVSIQISQILTGWLNRAMDIKLPDTTFIPSKSVRVSVPFEIVDDNIAEGNESVSVRIVNRPHQLYQISTEPVTIIIEDNEGVPRIGFSQNGTELEFLKMVEGEKQVFCVELLEPQDIGKIFTIKMSASANIKETGVKLNDSQSHISFLPSLLLKKCFSIEAPDNAIVDETKNIRYQIFMEGNKDVNISPSSLSVEVMDDDGSPMKPDKLNLNQVESKLHISWKARVSKFKPIDKFIVLITKIDATQPLTSRHRRQAHQLYEEHETTRTFYTMAIDKKILYLIQICAANGRYRNCSKITMFSTDPEVVKTYHDLIQDNLSSTSYPVIDGPTPLGLNGKGSGSGNDDSLGRMGIIAVIVGPAVAFTLAILLIITVLVCKCWGERRHYYPSHQEKVIKESNIEVKNFYRQRSSTSSLSTDWTLTSPNNFFLAPPPKRSCHSNTSTLGTPV